MNPPIVSRSLPEANDELMLLGPRAAVVSIGEPGGSTPYGFQLLNPMHLRLEFHDVGDDFLDDPRIVPPGPQHVRALLEHAKILRTGQLVYCHCNAGISRSTAVAYVLHCLWRGPGSEAEALRLVLEDRPMAQPNEVLVRLADEQMGRGGAMLAALQRRADLG